MAMPPEPRLRDLLRAATQRLRAAGVDSPGLSAQLLFSRVLGLDQVGLLLKGQQLLTPAQCQAAEALIARRECGEPIAYLLGEKEFFGRDFNVNPAVLIPRPETEHIVEEVLARFPADAALRFADCGTGSGVLAVTLAALYPRSLGLALDSSAQALAVARENARRHAVDARLQFLQADFGRLPCQAASLELIVANPPYVAHADYVTLSHEIRLFEPKQALVPAAADTTSASGLEAFQALVPQAAVALRPRGLLLMEIGHDQGQVVRALAQATEPAAACLWTGVDILPDLAGRDRVAVFQRGAVL